MRQASVTTPRSQDFLQAGIAICWEGRLARPQLWLLLALPLVRAQEPCFYSPSSLCGYLLQTQATEEPLGQIAFRVEWMWQLPAAHALSYASCWPVMSSNATLHQMETATLNWLAITQKSFLINTFSLPHHRLQHRQR